MYGYYEIGEDVIVVQGDQAGKIVDISVRANLPCIKVEVDKNVFVECLPTHLTKPRLPVTA